MANDVLVALMSIAASQVFSSFYFCFIFFVSNNFLKGGLEYYQIVELFEKMKKEV